MRNQILIICFIWFLLPGCTSTYLIKPKSEPVFLESLNSREGQIVLKNGKIYKGFNIQIAQDSIFWNTIERSEGINQAPVFVQKVNYRFHISEIKKIIFSNSKRGALTGFASGALIGTSVGLLLGLGSGVGDWTLLYIVAYTGIISPITGVIGMIIGSQGEKEEFFIDKASDSNPGKRQ